MKRAPALCLLTTLLAFYLLVPSSAVPLASELQIFDFACFDSFFCAFSVVGRDQTIRFCGLQDCKRCPCKRLNRCHRLAALQSRRYHSPDDLVFFFPQQILPSTSEHLLALAPVTASSPFRTKAKLMPSFQCQNFVEVRVNINRTPTLQTKP